MARTGSGKFDDIGDNCDIDVNDCDAEDCACEGGDGDGDEWDRNSCVLFLSCMCLVFSVFVVFLAVYVRVGMLVTGSATVASC